MGESILGQIIHTVGDIERNRFTLICPPEVEQRVRTLLTESGLEGMAKVQVSPFVPDGQIFVVNHTAFSELPFMDGPGGRDGCRTRGDDHA